MSNPAQSFVNGLLGAPSAIAAGIDNILSTAGFTSNDSQHVQNFANFVTFVQRATFDSAIRNMAVIVADYMIRENPGQFASAIASAGGGMVGKKAIVNACATAISNGAKDAAKSVARKRRVNAVTTILTVSEFAGKSGAAADRLKRSNPDLYDELDRHGLVGGYFLIEPVVT
ncbi:hypothetical protein [Marinibacterium profundimaris]|uniref:hypothetical protein n=1 Tax=Marinibacterium profundimaris TaxID=1679460 RepID=UPI00117FAB02|nr:hypothetical protein [Marinibacterium profundimaris]